MAFQSRFELVRLLLSNVMTSSAPRPGCESDDMQGSSTQERISFQRPHGSRSQPIVRTQAQMGYSEYHDERQCPRTP